MPARRRSLSTESGRDRMRARLAREYEKGNKKVRLLCDEGHYWFSKIDPKSIARAGVKQPRCEACQRLFADYEPPGSYTHDENAVCDHKCREAEGNDCKCVCGRKNHGVDRAKKGD